MIMKISLNHLKKLIIESLINEDDEKSSLTANIENKNDIDLIAKNISKPNKSSPTFNLNLNDKKYNAYLSNDGAIGGKYKFDLKDPKTGIEIDTGVFLEIPGLTGSETSIGSEVELSKHLELKKNDLKIFLSADAKSSLDIRSIKDVSISAPDKKVSFGIEGTFGKNKNKNSNKVN